MNQPPSPDRTPADYAAAVDAALREVPIGGKPVIPPARTSAEYLVVLSRAMAELDKLSKMLSIDTADSRDLSKLSMEEKLALGEENSRKLAALAYKISPITTLDRMEERLQEDTSSQAAADEVLKNLRSPRPSGTGPTSA